MGDAQVSCAHQVLHFTQCLCPWPPLVYVLQWFMPHAPLPSWLWWYNPPPWSWFKEGALWGILNCHV